MSYGVFPLAWVLYWSNDGRKSGLWGMRFKGLALLNLWIKPGCVSHSSDLWRYHKMETAHVGAANVWLIGGTTEQEEPDKGHYGVEGSKGCCRKQQSPQHCCDNSLAPLPPCRGLAKLQFLHWLSQPLKILCVFKDLVTMLPTSSEALKE